MSKARELADLATSAANDIDDIKVEDVMDSK
jgi:hypothetical protein